MMNIDEHSLITKSFIKTASQEWKRAIKELTRDDYLTLKDESYILTPSGIRAMKVREQLRDFPAAKIHIFKDATARDVAQLKLKLVDDPQTLTQQLFINDGSGWLKWDNVTNAFRWGEEPSGKNVNARAAVRAYREKER